MLSCLRKHDLDHVDDERAERDAPDVAHAAEHDHRQDRERDVETELVRADERRAWTAMKTPARPAVEAPSAKARSFVVTVLMPLLRRPARPRGSPSRRARGANPGAGRSRIIDDVIRTDHRDVERPRVRRSPGTRRPAGRRLVDPPMPFVPSVYLLGVEERRSARSRRSRGSRSPGSRRAGAASARRAGCRTWPRPARRSSEHRPGTGSAMPE